MISLCSFGVPTNDEQDFLMEDATLRHGHGTVPAGGVEINDYGTGPFNLFVEIDSMEL